jgi:hypothetical protein
MEVKQVHILALNESHAGKLEVQGSALLICYTSG